LASFKIRILAIFPGWSFLLLGLFLATAAAAPVSTSTTEATTREFLGNTLYFFDVEEKSRFLRENIIEVSHEYADLSVEFDLWEAREGLETICRLPEWYKTKVVKTKLYRFEQQRNNYQTFAPALSQLDQRCDFSTTNMKLTWDLASGVETVTFHSTFEDQHLHSRGTNPDREPRQVILATVLTSLATGALGLIWGSSHSSTQTDQALMDNQKHIIQVLRDNEHRAKSNTVQIGTIKKVLKGELELIHDINSSVESAFSMMATIFTHLFELDFILVMLQQLLTKKKLPPGLLQPEVLLKKFHHLEGQANLKGKKLAITHELDLFKLPTSIATFTNMTIRTVIHIPVVPQNHQFQLLRHQPTPLTLNTNNGTTMVQPVSEFTYLAVTHDRSEYFLLTPEQKEKCMTLEDKLACNFNPVIYSHRTPSCLFGLFSSNTTMTMQQCELSSVPKIPRSWPLNENNYLVFHPYPLSMTIQCPPNLHITIASQTFQGMKRAFVPEGCHAQNGFFTLYATKLVNRDEILFRVPTSPLSEAELRETHPLSSNTSILLAQLNKTVPITFHDPKFLPVPVPSTSWWDFLPHGLGAAAILGLVLLSAGLFCKYKVQHRGEFGPQVNVNVQRENNPEPEAD